MHVWLWIEKLEKLNILLEGANYVEYVYVSGELQKLIPVSKSSVKGIKDYYSVVEKHDSGYTKIKPTLMVDKSEIIQNIVAFYMEYGVQIKDIISYLIRAKEEGPIKVIGNEQTKYEVIYFFPLFDNTID